MEAESTCHVGGCRGFGGDGGSFRCRGRPRWCREGGGLFGGHGGGVRSGKVSVAGFQPFWPRRDAFRSAPYYPSLGFGGCLKNEAGPGMSWFATTRSCGLAGR